MVYKKIHLIVNEFSISQTTKIFDLIFDSIDQKQFYFPNFGHYSDDQSIRVRVDFKCKEAEEKTLQVIKKLKKKNEIIDYTPDVWENKNQGSSVVINACYLASKCCFLLSKLEDFIDIKESNLLHDAFTLIFFNKLFAELKIPIPFKQNNINTIIKTQDLSNLMNNSINAVLRVCKSNKNLFYEPRFIERFIHMLSNNLLISLATENSVFWRRFCRLYDLNVTEENKLLAAEYFCKELKEMKN